MKIMRAMVLSCMAIIVSLSIVGSVFANESDYIYESQRDEVYKDTNQWLTIKSSEGGTRIVTNDGSTDILLMDNYGGIYLNGDLFLNGEKVNEILSKSISFEDLQVGFVVILIIALLLIVVVMFVILKLLKKIRILEKQIKQIQ